MMDIPRACGQLISVGFEGQAVPAPLRMAIGEGRVGGVTLFGPNIVDPGQVAALVTGLRRGAPVDTPLVVSVDQEGGRVQRLREPLTRWPAMGIVGAAGDPRKSETLGAFVGQELAALGIGWNLAPVLDVNTNPNNPVIGDRAFGADPELVATHALAFWRGLRTAGLAGCGKHFPGHGDTTVDSHFDLPLIDHPEARLRAVEFLPFAKAAAAGVEALMTAHVMFPAFDRVNPATMSTSILTGLLRENLGFKGMIVSDDLSMKAVADRFSVQDIGRRALLAGVDHFLIRGPRESQEALFEGLVREAENSPAFRLRVADAALRVRVFKSTVRVGMPEPGALLPSLLGTPAHKALAGFFAGFSTLA